MGASVEMVIKMAEIKNTNPQLFGGIVGFCIGIVVMVFFGVISILMHQHTKKKEKKMLKATDFLGEEVIYDGGNIKVEGQVVAVDFDIEETGLVTTIYLEVDGLDGYYRINYEKAFRNIHLKGGK